MPLVTLKNCCGENSLAPNEQRRSVLGSWQLERASLGRRKSSTMSLNHNYTLHLFV